jgi:hypothetical protein
MNRKQTKTDDLYHNLAEAPPIHSSLFRFQCKQHVNFEWNIFLPFWKLNDFTCIVTDISKLSAHSFRGASTSKALGAGVSLKYIIETANWASAKTFYTHYFKDVVHVKNNFADKILNYL